ncbi:CxxH/CxxC protein [Paenibacillus sediminis]|uniref:CxxH/CxxC protein (TIGR04129 family) n=1 Tax=Paenibacillus sediminis TaxID=664909 RepID=A0ABS4H6S2_9BACL|nr:CxxH/CxxC protein [Paenibacillus sediminis]MBP1938229.1 CxxH/CxxC protein (TIGR04129 family) [Paenibacillus sediminis]
MYVVCKDHVELAIDKFVDEFEEAPDILDLNEAKFTEWEPPVKCMECDQEAKFLVV